MAASYLDDETLRPEAEVAAIEISKAACQTHPSQTRAALLKVLETVEAGPWRQTAQRIADRLAKK